MKLLLLVPSIKINEHAPGIRLQGDKKKENKYFTESVLQERCNYPHKASVEDDKKAGTRELVPGKV